MRDFPGITHFGHFSQIFIMFHLPHAKATCVLSRSSFARISRWPRRAHFSVEHPSSDSNSASPLSSAASSSLVVLIGWLGATPHQMKRYIRLYHQLGILTAAWYPSFASSLFPNRGIKKSKEVASELERVHPCLASFSVSQTLIIS